MARAPENIEVDPAQVKRAQDMWHNFLVVGKWSIIATLVVLVLMAAFLL